MAVHIRAVDDDDHEFTLGCIADDQGVAQHAKSMTCPLHFRLSGKMRRRLMSSDSDVY